MRISQAVKVIDQAYDTDLSTMLWGSPGIGKSSIVEQLAKARGVPMLDVRLSQLDPVDLRGVPYVEKGATRWATPHFLPNEKRDGPAGILFLDEINTSAQATQAAGYQLVLSRKLGEYVMPAGWRVIAAGNNEGDRSMVNKMAAALRNRFMHVDVETHPDDFREYGLRNGILPEVLGFLSFNSKCLNMFEIKENHGHKAIATPRTWEFVSRALNDKCDAETEYEMIKGLVGEGAATEFKGFLRYHRDLPNIDKLLMSPEKTAIPKEPATLYALSMALAVRASKATFPAIMKYTNRMKDVEFQVLTVKSCVIKDNNLGDTDEFNKWAADNAEALA